jgi:hypothetical protein
MKKVLKFNPGFVMLLLFTIGLFSMGLMSCGNGGENITTLPASSEVDRTTEQKADQPTTTKVKKTVPQGWKTYEFEDWSLSFPASWNGEEEVGIWWPGEGNMDMGRPPISVHSGGTPLMANSSFEDKVKSHMNGEALTKEKFSTSGFSGLKCTWENYGKKYLGVFVEEKIGSGVSVVHFVNCQAPAAEFEKYKGDFEKIVATFSR